MKADGKVGMERRTSGEKKPQNEPKDHWYKIRPSIDGRWAILGGNSTIWSRPTPSNNNRV